MIEISSDRLRALIMPRGATLAGLWHIMHSHSLVLGSRDQKAYGDTLNYFGALVGPVANRVANGRVEIDGTIWRMPSNEGSNCLHSGPQGLHTKDWEVLRHDAKEVVLFCKLEHGHGGLPGHREIEARYRIAKSDMLRLEISANSDRPTLFNIAHHPYWNLCGSPTIAEHRLEVTAQEYLPVDANTLPLGQMSKVAGTDYDFRTARSVPIDKVLDANLCLARTKHDTPRFCARLTAENGPELHLSTTEVGLQIYNGFGLPNREGILHGRMDLRACAGLALEPQGWPDAPNHPGFPSILVQPGETYRQVTEYRILA